MERTSRVIGTTETTIQIDWMTHSLGWCGRSPELGAEDLVFRIFNRGRNPRTGMVDMELVIDDGHRELYRNRVGTSRNASLSEAKGIIAEAGRSCVQNSRPASKQHAPSTLLTKAALEHVRNKLLNTIFWRQPQPRTPETFAIHASEVLDHDDFRVLDQFEELIGERTALVWLNDLMAEAGYSTERKAA